MNVNVIHYDDTDGESITLGVHYSLANAQNEVLRRLDMSIEQDKRILYARKSTKTTITFWVVDSEAATHNEGFNVTMGNLTHRVARSNWIQRYVITHQAVKP